MRVPHSNSSLPLALGVLPAARFSVKRIRVEKKVDWIAQTLVMNPKENTTERDARVMRLYEQLIEIEQRLIPTGLHVFGRAAELKEKADLLRMVASFDRPEQDARSLPGLVAEAFGIEGYDDIIQQTTTSETKDLIDSIVKEAIDRFCESGPDASSSFLSSRANAEVERSLPT